VFRTPVRVRPGPPINCRRVRHGKLDAVITIAEVFMIEAYTAGFLDADGSVSLEKTHSGENWLSDNLLMGLYLVSTG